MKLLIYGAQGIALGAYKALHRLYPKRPIECFLVTSKENNPKTLAGLPVRELAEYGAQTSRVEKSDTVILIATPENVQPEIEELLENHGFHNHQRMDAKRWAELQMLYHAKLGKFQPLVALPVGVQIPFLRVFLAMSHHDKPLRKAWTPPEWMLTVQSGAALTDKRIGTLCDDQGENISGKNGNYSELTTLYWLWRNRLTPAAPDNERNQYFGLAQYRRILMLSEEDVSRLLDNEVDVILPYPMPYEPDISAHHQRYLKEVDWQALLTALQECQPDYAKALPEVLGQPYLYNYNIIVARKAILRGYCEWLFPILERAEELSVPPGRDRSDRYIGYIAETLETLFFMVNATRYNIVHTGCQFLA